MLKKILLSATALLSFFVFAAAAVDDDWLTILLSKLEDIRAKYPQEKVHLHLDKPYYSLGDEIWLKAYVVNSENNELSALSKVLYVDVVDDRDSIHQTIALPLMNGLANGDIPLNDSLFTAGNYHINAYTRWMQNFSSDYIFKKGIVIGDARVKSGVIADASFTAADRKYNASINYATLADKAPLVNASVTYALLYKGKTISTGRAKTDVTGNTKFEFNIKEQYKPEDVLLQTTVLSAEGIEIQRSFPVYAQNVKPDLQFFPEGGKLVTGLRSKIAIKAVLPNGLGAEVKGKIVDQTNATVAEFSSAHAGMGIFALQPVAGSTYTAVIENGESQYKYALPAAETEGYVLGINHLGNDSLSVRVAVSAASVGKEVALIAQQNGVAKYTIKVKPDKQVINTLVPESKFSTGIVQFTLISADAVPLAERLVFVNHHDQLKMAITINKSAYSNREKVDMQIGVKDAAGQPVEGNFSVAVTDLNKVATDEDAETGILADLLLASDLKGYIEKPNYYFAENNEERMRHLDYLMLTQGWRRFKWTDINTGTLPAIKFQPQQSLTITGKLTTMGNKPMPNGKVTLYANTPGGIILTDTTTDANGNFIFQNLDFNGDVKFVVRAKNAKDKNSVKVVLDNPVAASPVAGFTNPDLTSNAGLVSYLQSSQKRIRELGESILGNTIMLSEVKVKERKYVDKNAIKGSSRIGGGIPDIVVKKEKLTAYTNIMSAFYGLAGITVRNNLVYRVGRTTSLTQPDGAPMLVIMNGMEIFPEMLQNIAPSDVEGIEILKSGANTAIYGDAGYWGVIVVTLKSGASGYASFKPSYLDRILVNGYAVEREFYSPAYDKPSDKDNLPDRRSTIYWQPNVVTDQQGNAKISYFTADDAGVYKVVAEGINLDGKLVRQVYTYNVK